MNTFSVRPRERRTRSRWTPILALLGLTLTMALGSTATALAGTGFIAQSYPAAVQGTSTGTEELFLSGGHYSCPGSSLSGELSNPSKTVSTAPSWGSLCKAPLSSVAQVKANGCKFEFTATGSSSPFGGEMAIGPSGCGPMTITGSVGFCSYSIPSQSGLNATFTNTGGTPNKVVANLSTSSLHYTQEGYCAKNTYENGAYDASWELAGWSGSEMDPISISTEYETAPSATTSGASGVSSSGATLNAQVNPNVLATTYQFEYGLTAEYGSVAPASPGSAGSGSSAVTVSEGVSGLTAGTLYHYRVKATNSAGTRYGKDRTFETLPSGATGAEIKWPSGTSTLTATGSSLEQKFVVPKVGTVKCTEFSGTATGLTGTGASNFALEGLSYHNKGVTTCSGPLGTTPTVKTNGCPYEFHVGESKGAGEAQGSVYLGTCTTENAMLIDGGSICTIRIPYRQNLSPVTYRTSGEKVEAEMAMTNVTYESWGLCGTGTYTGGTYSGTLTISGNKGGLSIK